MLITEILSRNARLYSNEVALVGRNPGVNQRREITWHEFDRQASGIATYLIEKGLKKGDRALILMQNCIEWLPVYFGILRAGCLAVPVDHAYDTARMAHCAELTEPKAIFFEASQVWATKNLKAQLNDSVSAYVQIGKDECLFPEAVQLRELLDKEAENIVFPELDLCDEAVLYFTSGTTGLPKATVLTHRNLEFACYIECFQHQHTHKDNFLCLTPLYHCGALVHWLGVFIMGGKGVILKDIQAKWILEAVSEEGVTAVWLTVPWAKDIICRIENGEVNLQDYNLEQWRLMHMGAQPIPPSLIKEWRGMFPTHHYNTTYGLTESTGPGCILLGIDNAEKIGAIGKTGFDWEAKVVDDELRQLPPNTAGHLMLKGPGIMKGYYKDPEATQKVLIDGWLLTGDICRMDDDGYFWLVEREEYIIHVQNHTVYPIEIENFLVLHPKVQDAAVFSIPGEKNAIAALIQPKAGQHVTAAMLRDFCAVLPQHKRPSQFFWGEIPRSLTGKIEKYVLQMILTGNSLQCSESVPQAKADDVHAPARLP